ncbi:MAG: ComF family protein [Gammaproteobacteria bacterium]|nr:ComF family protein [Gammaproteobacteria bacterium]
MALGDLFRWLQGTARCYLCGGRSAGLLCEICREQLPGPRSACLCCGRRLPRTAAACGACVKHRLPYDLLWSPMDYRFPVDRLILALKFKGDLVAGRVLATLLLPGPDCGSLPRPRAILPMPLHPRRQRARGFNQCSEIARHLGKELALPVLEGYLERWRNDPPQSGLDALQRRRNVRGAYRLRAGMSRLPPSVLLLDDVVTTGSTVHAAATVLKQGGVKRVEVWAVARAAGAL